MGFRVVLTKRAQKELAVLDRKSLLLVSAAIDKIQEAEDPRGLSNAKKLRGVDDGWRWRVGTYRILGVVRDKEILIEVFRVGHRRDVYRNL
ncbi:MAG: type II toxin-antitoxin system RelE/ParE family toxin [Eggerthellaceae bacterium]|nr:type II toxin-antitoxin system RelE/ParE family toxin [Eggerthellaceae bacterium]